MRTPFHPRASAALLLAAAGLAGVWMAARLPAANPFRGVAPTPALDAGARVALERCLEQVTTIHDMYWAAACTKTEDDWPDCTLPVDQARPLNAARAAEDQRCLVEATEVQRVAGHAVLHR